MPTNTKMFTSRKPGAVSHNLARLRTNANVSTAALAEATGIGKSTIEKMEVIYEPPSNHPYLPVYAAALASHVGKDANTVLAELQKGGREFEFSKVQLARIYSNHRQLAPDVFFAVPKSPKSSVTTKQKKSRISKGKIQQLIEFFDTDKKIEAMAKTFGWLLPRAKKDATGKVLEQDDRSITLRALRLRAQLKHQGVDLNALMGDESTPVVRKRKRNGYRDIANNVYEVVARFNQARTLRDAEIKISLDVLEPILRDYLRTASINEGVLIHSDIEKLIPLPK